MSAAAPTIIPRSTGLGPRPVAPFFSSIGQFASDENSNYQSAQREDWVHRVLRRDVIPRIFFIQGVRIRSLAALTIEAAKAVIENKQQENLT